MTVPGYLACANLATGDKRDFVALQTYFSHENPNYRLDRFTVEGALHVPPPARQTYIWLFRGQVEARVEGQWSPEPLAPASDPAAWHSLQPGDALVLGPKHGAELRGHGVFLQIIAPRAVSTPHVGLRRLRYIEDTAGGCNVGEDAFRRLQIVWQDATANPPDGDNVLGCHTVYIAAATSRSHYHPVPSMGGGLNQHELYLVLDPADYDLKVTVETPGVWTYPEPGNWQRYDFTPLQPGDVMAIKAGVVHRAVDVLAGVIAVPGFKPHNEIQADPDIANATAGRSPHNPDFVSLSPTH